ncbi:unnamed protein product [Brassica rapa]|uniref:Uncharacterized protein n=2 Tax=Brassica TaxID=3705 RepID=A0A8D9D5V0_BRACM|nr:unnamed protein product [Brassica napus]CAG7867822.1 unnamed protein product [Brassica rapa]
MAKQFLKRTIKEENKRYKIGDKRGVTPASKKARLVLIENLKTKEVEVEAAERRWCGFILRVGSVLSSFRIASISNYRVSVGEEDKCRYDFNAPVSE